MEKEIKPDQNHVVTKSNELIEAKYNLGLQELRLIAILVSQISPQDRSFEPYTFKVKDLADLIGIPRKDLYRDIEAVTRKLVGTRIELYDRAKKERLQATWMASAKYEYGQGIVHMQIADALRPHLLQLRERFTEYTLVNLLRLRSKYAIRLYELAQRHVYQKGMTYSLDELYSMLGKEENITTGYFVRKILEPAVREINKRTDLRLSYNAIKQSRKFIGFEFRIGEKEAGAEGTDARPLPPALTAILAMTRPAYREHPAVIAAVSRAYRKHGAAYCKRNIAYAERATSNYPAYLAQALRYDWGIAVIPATKPTAVDPARVEEIAQEAAARTALELKVNYFKSLSKEEQERIRAEAIAKMPAFLRKLKHPLEVILSFAEFERTEAREDEAQASGDNAG